jgi:hypothetical protein
MRIIVARKKMGLWIPILAALVIAVPGYIMSWYFWAYPRVVEERQTQDARPTVVGRRSASWLEGAQGAGRKVSGKNDPNYQAPMM